ncbi:unnamed protein product [Bursaphelenchus okinawaensis]|uniref:Uncharacterized protein n=1 Tax=Bursaphelenchus okinawaensis TaxID=465554 RepID=A0A811K5F7_9BILA|nr:unnamed protein product [Bursaphelenchus okinawaensis]CAG9092916.1 unnamed protein product [Bursaphelenchus okinawaensis]
MFVVVQLGWLSSAIFQASHLFYSPTIKYAMFCFWLIDFVWFILIWVLLAGILKNRPQFILSHIIYCIFLTVFNSITFIYIILSADGTAILINTITLTVLFTSLYHENICYKLMNCDNYFLH